jgi:hypothetical protein
MDCCLLSPRREDLNMPKGRYPLRKGEEKRLEVSWKIGWKNVVLRLDGLDLGTIATREELKRGQRFTLPDGSVLEVQLSDRGLELLHDSKPVPGSSSDPIRAVNLAAFVVFWMGGGNLVIGILGIAGVTALLLSGWLNVFIGLAFLGLGFQVRRQSAIALMSAIGLTVCVLAWTLVSLVQIIAEGGIPLGIGGLFIGIAFLNHMVKGYKVLKVPDSQLSKVSIVSRSQVAQKSCPNCGVKYYLSDYSLEAPIWTCSNCGRALPKE